MTFEPGTVEIRLPFKRFGITYYKKIGFRFNILAWSILCQLFEPEIEFHEVDELLKTQPKEMFEKMVMAGALSYGYKHKQNVTLKNVQYWLYKLPREKAEKIQLEIQTTILSSKVMGKTISQIVSEKREEKKN